MRKRYSKLRNDTRGGGESIFRPFVLMFVLISLMLTVVAMVQHTNISANQVNGAMNLDAALGEYNYTFIDPQVGIPITYAMVTDHMVHPTKAPIIFTDSRPGKDNDKKYIQIIVNNKDYEYGSDNMWKKYTDFISVQREVNGYGPLISHSWNGAAIPISSFVGAFDEQTNTSKVGFFLSGLNDTIFMHTVDNNSGRIYNANYTMYYGFYLYRTGNVDFWSTIRMVSTASLPGMNPLISFFIAALFWAVTLFMVFTLVSRIVPFIGGN